MSFLPGRACAWLLWVAALPALAQADAALTLTEVEQLALSNQPQLVAQAAQVRAARERAVSARQLPDPMLNVGVINLPANGDDRFSLSRDFMTMSAIGLSQEFPRAGKRRLRGEAESLKARTGEAELAALEDAIRRDTALAYLQLWQAERAVALVEAMVREASRERDAAEIAFRAGRLDQAQLLDAGVALELLQDRVRKLEQDAAEAREGLRRYTGAPLAAPIADVTPALPEPPELPALLAALDRHPELRSAHFHIAEQEVALALAREAYKPDWRVELMYAWRPDFSEMASLQVGIDLPVFTARRQDREVAAAAAEAESVHAMHEDHARRLAAQAAAAWRAWSQMRERLQRYDAAILPSAERRTQAALAAWRAGRGALMEVLDARRAALDVQLMRLDLQADLLRRQAELRYLDAGESS